MKTRRYGWVVVMILATGAGCGRKADEASTLMDDNLTEEQAVQASAIAALDELGGMVNWEEQGQGDPRLEVNFSNKPITDAHLKEIIQQLKRDKEFRYLDLSGTRVTDEGLKGLKELKHLRTLVLSRTEVTDAGLKGLEQVESLDLSRTRVTDGGVKGLKNHKRLKWLNLDGTEVTPAGLSEIKKALPECTIDTEEEKGQRLVRRVREVVSRSVPAGATVLVISHEDDDLLELGGRQGWHFPRNEDGTYRRSLPADGAQAVAWLEAVRAKRGQFLVIPETASWWLEDYKGFKRHLEEHYRLVVHEDKVCFIFDLR
jgi:hypothetical protein